MNYCGTDEIGTKRWFKDGVLHREDGPAVEYKNGRLEWYRNGKFYLLQRPNGTREWYKDNLIHREDGPAIESHDGTRKWYINDKLHSDDGPAIIYNDGTSHWYKNGKLHRDNGPAIEKIDGTRAWYQNGEPHRRDGPAFEYPDGTYEWWINGEPISDTDTFTKELLDFLEEIAGGDIQRLSDQFHLKAKELIKEGKMLITFTK